MMNQGFNYTKVHEENTKIHEVNDYLSSCNFILLGQTASCNFVK